MCVDDIAEKRRGINLAEDVFLAEIVFIATNFLFVALIWSD